MCVGWLISWLVAFDVGGCGVYGVWLWVGGWSVDAGPWYSSGSGIGGGSLFLLENEFFSLLEKKVVFHLIVVASFRSLILTNAAVTAILLLL